MHRQNAVRPAEKRQATNSSVASTARLGGLHHRYDFAAFWRCIGHGLGYDVVVETELEELQAAR